MPRQLSEAQIFHRQKQIERYEKLQAMIRLPAEQQEMEGLREIYVTEMSRRAMGESRSRRKRAKNDAVGANACAPPGGGDDAKAGGVRDNLDLRMSDAIKAEEQAGLIGTGARKEEEEAGGQGRQGGGRGRSDKMTASAKDTGSSSNNVVVKEEKKKKKDHRQVEDTGSSSNNVVVKQDDAPEIAALVEALPAAPTSDAVEQVQQPPGQPAARPCHATHKLLEELSELFDCGFYEEVEPTSRSKHLYGGRWGMRRSTTVCGFDDRQGRLRSQGGLRSQLGGLEPLGPEKAPLPSLTARRCVSTVRCAPFGKKFQRFGNGQQRVLWRGCFPSFVEGYEGGPVLSLTNGSLQNAKKRSSMPRIYMKAEEDIREGMLVCFMGGCVTERIPQELGGLNCVEIKVKLGEPPCWVLMPEVLSGFSLGWGANSLCFGSATGAVNTSLWSHKPENVCRENNCRIQTVSSCHDARSSFERCCWIVADRDIAAGEEILVEHGGKYADECQKNGSVQRCMSVYGANILKNTSRVKRQSVGRSESLPRRPVGRPPKISKLHGAALKLYGK